MAATSNGPVPVDSNRGPMILGISWFTAALACITVSVRVYTRLGRKASGWDDYLIHAALVLHPRPASYVHGLAKGSANGLITGDVSLRVHPQYSSGQVWLRQTHQIRPPGDIQIIMYTTLVEIQNGIGTFLVKASVCFFVLRLIHGTNPKIRMLLWATIAVLFAITLATVMVIGLQCIPFRKTWHPEMHGSCISKSIQTQLIRILGSWSS